jgi:hypothetical protein
MTSEDRNKVKLLWEQILKTVKRPDIVMFILSDMDADGDNNTQVMTNLDKIDAVRFMNDIARLAGPIVRN